MCRCGAVPVRQFHFKSVYDVQDTVKTRFIDSSLGIAVKVIGNLQHASAAKTFKRLDGGMLSAVLRVIDRLSHNPADFSRKFPQFVSRRTDPLHRFLRVHRFQFIAVLLWSRQEKCMARRGEFPAGTFYDKHRA